MKKDVHFYVKILTYNSIIATLYVVLTLLTQPIAYSYMQLRLSEMLCILVFFNPHYTLGLTLGCFLANLFSTVGPLDMLMGTGATLIACLIMVGLSYCIKNMLLSAFIPAIVNALIIPWDIYISSLGSPDPMVMSPGLFFTMAGWIFLGEFIALIVIGYPIFLIMLKKMKNFSKLFFTIHNEDVKW